MITLEYPHEPSRRITLVTETRQFDPGLLMVGIGAHTETMVRLDTHRWVESDRAMFVSSEWRTTQS